MLICQDRVYRNLQEQVVKNMEDIEFILKQRGVLNEYGLRIVEVADSLPSVSDYKTAHSGWAYGDTFLVGDDAPYSAYILTRANGDHLTDYWFEIGSVPGTFGSVTATVGANVGTPTVTVTYENGDVAFAFDNLKGDQGPEGGTEVIANPETTGTEDSLTSIEIDGTKYVLGGGDETHLYEHNISFDAGSSMNGYLYTRVYTTSASSITYSEFADWLYNNNYRNSSSALTATGFWKKTWNGTEYVASVCNIYNTSGSLHSLYNLSSDLYSYNIRVGGAGLSEASTSNYRDNVRQIF